MNEKRKYKYSMMKGILGQVLYLIVSIPDLCTLTYFNPRGSIWKDV